MKYLTILFSVLMIISCDSTTESEPESMTGFWQAKEVAQHFWLEHIRSDSLTGFGQLGVSGNLGIVEWVPITVGGNIIGNDISLWFTLSDSTNIFNGEIFTARNFYGLWVIASDTITVTYNKRITYN